MKNVSIRVKVLIPIIVLTSIILLVCGINYFNQKNLLETSYIISDDCSGSIELLLNIESNLESIGKTMYAHCKAENATTKSQYGATIQEQVQEMKEYFALYEAQPLTAKEKEYFGALKKRFDKYQNGLNEVLESSMKNDVQGQLSVINVIEQPAEDYLLKKIDSLINMRKAEMEKALDSQNKAYQSGILATLIFIVIAFLMAGFTMFICAKWIIRPMRYISEKLNKMIRDIEEHQGNLSERILLSSKDEIGIIGESVNSFIETLQNVMKRITVSSVNMNQIVDEVEKEVNLADDSAKDISAVMEELTAAMTDVSSSVGGIGGLLSEIGDSVQELSNGAQELLEYSDQMEESATRLKENAIQNKNETSNITLAIIAKLQKAMEESKKVEQINDLTNDILGIAKQTNLLSLNASIEAARAGEAGRGFSVVATEISQLADSSRDTATNIQQINQNVIETVRELTNQANNLVSYIQQTILPDYDNFVNAGVQYNDDANHVNEIVNKFHEMSDELTRQSENVQKYADSISLSVKESTEGIQLAASNTDNLSNKITNIASKIGTNKEVANVLEKEADRFIIA